MKRRSRLARWWLDLALGDKGLLVVALPLVAVAVTGIIRLTLTREQEATTELLARASATRNITQELLLSLTELESGVHGYALTGERSQIATLPEATKTIPPRLTQLQVSLGREEDQLIFGDVLALAHRQLALVNDIVSLIDAGESSRDPEVKQRLVESRQVMNGLRRGLSRLHDSHEALASARQTELSRLRDMVTPIILFTFFAGLGGAIAAGWLFADGIAKRVNALRRNADRLARGERLRRERSRGRDEIGRLDRAIRHASLLLRQRERELRVVNAELQRTVHDQAVLNRELEAFSYSVSHDLRAPLRSIDGFAQALREDWGERLDPSGQEHLSRVRNAAQRMGRLIDDLLKLSKLSRAQINRLDVDLTRIAREITDDLGERNPSRRVTWEIAEGLHAKCDPSLARIVLENLLGNAWKFTSKTPDAKIEFYAMAQSNRMLFVVRDNGAGFDMKYVDKLFAPFQRLHGEREFPGTGIGLATVQRIIHKHGGEVQTRAEVDNGAAFYFTLEPEDGAAAA